MTCQAPQNMMAGQTTAKAITTAVIQLQLQVTSAMTLINTAKIGQTQSQRFITTSYAFNEVIFFRLSSVELTMTDRELKAIAAAAIIGFRKPSAATGMPTVL